MMILLIVVFAILFSILIACGSIAIYIIYSSPIEHRERLKSAFWQGFFGALYRPKKKTVDSAG